MYEICDWDPLSALKEKWISDSKTAPIVAMMHKADKVAEKEASATSIENFSCLDDYACAQDNETLTRRNARRYRIIAKRLERLVEKNPLDPAMHALLADCYEQIPEYHEKRVAEYERAIELAPEETMFKKALCVSLWDEAQCIPTYYFESASLPEGKGAPSEWLESVETRFAEGRLRDFENLVGRCLQICDEVLESDPCDSLMYQLKADILDDETVNRPDEALEALNNALKVCSVSERDNVHQLIGMFFMRWGRDADAIKHFQVVLEHKSAEECDESARVHSKALEMLIEECEKRLQLEIMLRLVLLYVGIRY